LFCKLQVHGFSGSTGDFGIKSPLPTLAPTFAPTTTFSPTGPAPENDVCNGAVSLELNGEPLNGSNMGARLDETPLCFSDEFESLRGVWYSLVVGADVDVVVHLCDGVTGFFDTKMTIFEGSCDGLVCFGENDDGVATNFDCALASAYGWPAEAGKTYYVLVSFFSNWNGICR
jgi:hypothetical protein